MTAAGALCLTRARIWASIFDLLALVVAARLTGQDLSGVGDADCAGIGEHRQPSPHMGVRNGVVVEVEADIGRFARLDRDLLDQEIWTIRQRQQPGRFLGEGLADADCVLPVGRDAAAPVIGLGVECLHIGDVEAGAPALK